MRVALFSLVMLSSCAKIPGTAANLEARARDVLSDHLYDAESARFRGLAAIDSYEKDGKSERIICGQVNAKNRLGAYIGFRNFIVSRDARFGVVDPQSKIIQADTDEEIDEKAYQDGFNAVWPSCAKRAKTE